MPDLPVIRTALGGFPDYELIDSGRRCKLERFGPVTVIRGEPKAWWEPVLPARDWDRAQAVHDEDSGWDLRPGCPRQWALRDGPLTFLARLSDTSKHLGLFPEQSPHWRAIREAAAPGARLLNLFGYTGAATLAAAAAGWLPTHVDASKPAVAWARENQAASGLAEKPVRWIVEDAMKYVRREIKRGSRYDGILLDPPAFGRGPDGGIWKVERQLPELLDLCRQTLTDTPRLLILTTYNIEASALMLRNLLADLMQPFGGRIEAGELALSHAAAPNRLLPLSIYAKW
ncbi:MAG TPA: class I SAM-dependent methyltransferase, partial [Kiritimatiellia bacterium]|nr:class I SAM-dependent methyltransferase [Kiritimatiellia bacterium]HRX06372.1 class I SAM-dependent methyltransferase [Kiritimatiellia bacterium]